MNLKRGFKIITAVLPLLVIPIGDVIAGGYAIPPQTARAVGLANAVTAGVDDPSAVYANPAALTEIQGNQVLGGLNYINSVNSVTNGGRRSTNKHDDNFIPTLFGNYHIPGTALTAGLGLYTPFGLATSYADNSFTRFGAIRSELKSLYVTPTLAWRVNPLLSVGGGISFVHSSALFTRALFLGPGTEGHLRLADTDNGYTYTLGVLVKPHGRVKLGFNYRGRVDLNFDTAQVKVGDAMGAVSTARSKGTQIPLPPVISLGIQWLISPDWAVEFDYNYTHWSEFRHLKARFNPALLGGTLGGLFVEELWKDAHTLRLGTSYRLNQQFELRGGVILDETPIPGRTLSPSIPGANLLGLNAGLGYTWNNLAIDVGYMAVFYETRKVLNNVLEADNLANTVAPGRDKYQTFNNFVSIHFRYHF